MINFKAKDYSQAITLGEKILESNNSHTDAYYIVGLSASMLDQH